MNTIKNTPDFCEVLLSMIKDKISISEFNWIESIILYKDDSFFYQNFSLVTKNIEFKIPKWSIPEILVLNKYYPGFEYIQFDTQQLCRILLMINIPTPINFIVLKKLSEVADINELISLYKGLFFFKNANQFEILVQEGVRTNMTVVFDSICLYNPFASKYLSIDSWNQLVLKAIFMNRPLYQILDLDLRKNEKLAFIVNDFIEERWSAGRNVTPEIWRLLSGFENEQIVSNLLKAISVGDILTMTAAKKVLKNSSFYNSLIKIDDSIFDIEISWEEIGKQYYNNVILG